MGEPVVPSSSHSEDGTAGSSRSLPDAPAPGDPATGPTRVAICALTYLRPNGLTRLLEGIAALDVPDGVEADVVIVDNDPNRSAESLVTSTKAASTWRGPDLHYVAEPARGISQARNAAVSTALELHVDWICFIDDDEWPDRRWLTEYLASAGATGADIVSGPIEPVFDEPPPQWVLDGGFFQSRRHEHNHPMHYARTSSVLIRASVLDLVPGPFDPAFGLSGGEDTHLFAQLREAGCSLVWSDTAVVYEAIPASRTTPKWLLQREFRRGQTLGLSLRHRNAPAPRLAKRGAKGLVEIAAGAATTALGLPRGRAQWFRGVRRMGFGAGILSGLVGRQLQEYTVIHGS
jgi:GT2 family glycosyltransferase